MQFTPQQLAGGHKYSSKTKIGNWQEEIALEESKIANFERRAASGNLSMRKQQIKVARCTEAVQHTYSPDGQIRFGDCIILKHDITGAILACDIFNSIEPGIDQYLVSGSLGCPEPVARNTFRILRPPNHLKGIEDDDYDVVLRMGQAFCIGCNESLLATPGQSVLSPALYLSSIRKNERTSTKRSNKQAVYLSPTNGPDSVWTCVLASKGHKNSSQRYLSSGQPLTVQDSVQITHRQTNMYLTFDPSSKEMSEFGVELECFADRTVSTGKMFLMSSEFKGLSTAQTLEKPDSPNYGWHIVTSASCGVPAQTRELPPRATSHVLIVQLHEYIRSRGVDAFWDLRAYFENLSVKLRVTMGRFDKEDFKEAFIDWGSPFEAKFFDPIIDTLDPRKLGLVDFREFIGLVRGRMSDTRMETLNSVYSSLVTNHQGNVLLDQAAKRYDGRNHPLVGRRGLRPEETLLHFIEYLEYNGRSSVVITRETFFNYFADLSAAVDDDEYFDAVIRSLW